MSASAEFLKNSEGEKRSWFDLFGKGSGKWVIPALLLGIAVASAFFINEAFLSAPATSF